MSAKIVIAGPEVPARKRCIVDERQVQIVLCRLSPNADVGQTGKHFPRTATAAFRYAFEIAFGPHKSLVPDSFQPTGE